MAGIRHRRHGGFTLFELIVAMAVIAALWGLGVASMPRLLSGSGPDALARRLAGAGQEARQMAMLQQRPWELLIDLDQGVFYRAPLGAVARRERRLAGETGDGSLSLASRGGSILSGRAADGGFGETAGPGTEAAREDELRDVPTNTLRDARAYDRLAFAHDDGERGEIDESAMPEGTAITRVWTKDGSGEAAGRVSLVFGPRGFVRPAAIWIEDADDPEADTYTLYFQGLLPPMVASGALLPNEEGVLAPEGAPASGGGAP